MPTTRRQFLLDGAGAIVGTGLLRAISPSRILFTRAPAKKILILGAGMAGLAAGFELSQLGHDITILEARTRPGGRVHTLREPFTDELYAEEGAARIPENHNLTLKYVKLFELPLEPMYPPGLSALRMDAGRTKQITLGEFTEGLGQFFGPDLNGRPERWSKIKGGTDLLPAAFAKKLADKIIYGAAVVRIEQDAKEARAVFEHKGKRQTFTADRILSTIPFSVLRTIELPSDFSDRKREIINRTQYDAVSRVYLQLKHRSAWEEKGLNGFALTQNGVEIWHPTWSQPGPRGILMTYARPGEAERITRLNAGERINSTTAELDTFFPGVRADFEHGTSKCWTEDQWSRGAWAFVGPQNLIAGQKAEGRIHFAGEHLSPIFSWIQGALWSALKVVKEIDEAPAVVAQAA